MISLKDYSLIKIINQLPNIFISAKRKIKKKQNHIYRLEISQHELMFPKYNELAPKQLYTQRMLK